MGLLDGLSLKDAPSDPNAIPNSTYDAVVSNVELKESGENSKKPGHPYLVFTYRIQGGDYANAEIQEWKSVHPDDDQRQKGFLKQRLLSLGIPEDRVDDVDADDLIGIDVKITTRMKDGFVNISKVVVDDGTVTDDSGSLTSL